MGVIIIKRKPYQIIDVAAENKSSIVKSVASAKAGI